LAQGAMEGVLRPLSMEGTPSGQGDPLTGLNKKEDKIMKISEMDKNLLYLIDIRSRFSEVGAWAVTQTASGDLVLRRVLSLGSLWELAEKGKIEFNGMVAVTEGGYRAMSSEGFTSGGGNSWRVKNVAAVIESGGKTHIKAFRVHIFPEGTQLLFPAKQPVQLNQAVRQAAYSAVLLRQALSWNEWYIVEGQSNTFQYAELIWEIPDDDRLEQGYYSQPTPLEFAAEHKESLAELYVSKNEDGVLWSFRPEAEVTEAV
jgi:hypothetical protein